MSSTVIEEILKGRVLKDEKEVSLTDLPIDEQIEYLIKFHFVEFASAEAKSWRMQNVYFITNKNQEKIRFKLNNAQLHFFTNIIEKGFRRIIILKARQLGFSTFVAIYFLDEIIFNPNSEALQIAHTQKDATELFNRKIKYTVSNLPPAMKLILDTNTRRSNRIEFAYPDKSTSAISVANSGRSGTYNYVHVSELAKLSKTFPERAEEVIKGTLPAVGMSGRIFIESTAEGMTGVFYEMFDASWKRRHIITPAMSSAEFYPVFYNWQFDVEQIDEATANGIIPISSMEDCEIDWKQYKEDNELSDKELSFYYLKYIQQNRDIDKLHQEYPTTPNEAFIGTGSNFFSLKKIFAFTEKIDDTQWKRYSFLDGELYGDKDGDWWIREEAQPGRAYILGGDIAQGLETGDYTAMTIIGLDRDIKAFYRGHCEPDQADVMARYMGRRYNMALLAIESNADGNWVNSALVNANYPNIYLRTAYDDITRTVTRSYGWLTNANTRKNILDNMKVWFNSQTILNNRILLEEMLKFVRNKNGKPMAMGENHDDLIFSTAIALAAAGTRKENIKEIKVKGLLDYIFSS